MKVFETASLETQLSIFDGEKYSITEFSGWVMQVVFLDW